MIIKVIIKKYLKGLVKERFNEITELTNEPIYQITNKP